MDFLGAALSSVASIIFFTLVAVCAFKSFQVATLLSEIKDLLGDIKRNTNAALPVAHSVPGVTAVPMSLDSAENLLRAVAELDHPIPPVIEHQR